MYFWPACVNPAAGNNGMERIVVVADKNVAGEQKYAQPAAT
jgi:hypothetical protein